MSGKAITVGVIGAGTMGQGIAQLALQAGHPVILVDQSESQLNIAKKSLDTLFGKFVAKSKICQRDKDNWLGALTLSSSSQKLTDAKLVIEAIVEKINIKQEVFKELESVVSEDAILATNTSSLSVTAIAFCLNKPQRFIGLHFFNPAGIMPLVEVIEALQTSSATTETSIDLMTSWGKTPVRCKNTPGFVVNRVARPFYVESFRLIEEQITTPTQLDASIRSAGFKMGPCELTDFIGQDVNYAVSCSLFKSLFYPAHLRPSYAQGSLVEAGFLGRKTGKGFYDYNDANQRVEAENNDSSSQTDASISFVSYGNHPWVAEQDPDSVQDKSSLKSTSNINKVSSSEKLIGVLENNIHLYASDGRMASDWEAKLNVPILLADIKHPDKKSATVAVAAGPKAKKAMANRRLNTLGEIVWTLVDDTPGLINLRVISMIINEAAICAIQGIATPEGIDSALKGGVNYPLGAFEWLSVIGKEVVINTLTSLRLLYGSRCYTVPRLLLQSKDEGDSNAK